MFFDDDLAHTGKIQKKLLHRQHVLVLSMIEDARIFGIGIKFKNIRRKTTCEGKHLNYYWHFQTKAQESKRIRYPRSLRSQ